jgi:hypothetical protein
MIGLAERFSRDLEDFAMLVNGGAEQPLEPHPGDLTRTTPIRLSLG